MKEEASSNPYRVIDPENLSHEQWTPLPSMESQYQFSNFGRMRSMPRKTAAGRMIKKIRYMKSSGGYYQVTAAPGEGQQKIAIAPLLWDIHRVVVHDGEFRQYPPTWTGRPTPGNHTEQDQKVRKVVNWYDAAEDEFPELMAREDFKRALYAWLDVFPPKDYAILQRHCIGAKCWGIAVYAHALENHAEDGAVFPSRSRKILKQRRAGQRYQKAQEEMAARSESPRGGAYGDRLWRTPEFLGDAKAHAEAAQAQWEREKAEMEGLQSDE